MTLESKVKDGSVERKRRRMIEDRQVKDERPTSDQERKRERKNKLGGKPLQKNMEIEEK